MEDQPSRNANGAAAAATDPFGSAVSDLRAFLAETDREERRLKHELVVLQAKTRRAKRALDTLTAEEPKPKTKRTRAVQTGVAPEKQTQAIEALRDGARTIREVAERMGVRPDEARRVIYFLRDNERVRLTGKVQTDGAPQPSAAYALMPEET